MSTQAQRKSLGLGISPCPNDTFIFDALVRERIPLEHNYQLHMADVEELNSLARQGRLEVTKLSLAAMVHVLDKYIMLNSGAALGRGCGPLVVSDKNLLPEKRSTADIAVPGVLTTANLLLSLHGGFTGSREAMVFDKVMPAVQEGRVGLGVIIHEGRFTYQNHGLDLVLDLGAWWEGSSGLPLPLGVIAVRRDCGMDVAQAVDKAVRSSLEYARENPEESLPFVRAHAQEMNPKVMADHIDTFVNEFSLDLGNEGRDAISRLLRRGADEAGIMLPDFPLFVRND